MMKVFGQLANIKTQNRVSMVTSTDIVEEVYSISNQLEIDFVLIPCLVETQTSLLGYNKVAELIDKFDRPLMFFVPSLKKSTMCERFNGIFRNILVVYAVCV